MPGAAMSPCSISTQPSGRGTHASGPRAALGFAPPACLRGPVHRRTATARAVQNHAEPRLPGPSHAHRPALPSPAAETYSTHSAAIPAANEAQTPVGGVKESGYGRFGGLAGVEVFTDLRWVAMQMSNRPYPF
jgi:hypothetical protein